MRPKVEAGSRTKLYNFYIAHKIMYYKGKHLLIMVDSVSLMIFLGILFLFFLQVTYTAVIGKYTALPWGPPPYPSP